MRELLRAAAVGMRGEDFGRHGQTGPQECEHAAIGRNRESLVVGVFQEFARRTCRARGNFVEGLLSLIVRGEVNSRAVRGPTNFVHAAVKWLGQGDLFSSGSVVQQ